MRCQKCGYELPQDSIFCQYCGMKISDEQNGNINDGDNPIKEVEVDECQPDSLSNSSSEQSVSSLHERDCSYINDEEVANNQNESSNDSINIKPIVTESSSKNVRFCSTCGGKINGETNKCISCGKQSFQLPKRTAHIILIFSVLVGLVVLNIFQYVNSGMVLADLEAQLNTYNSPEFDLKSTLAQINEKAGYYDEICMFLQSGNVGYASDNFNTSESIILVNKKDINRKFNLTAYWPNGGSVTTSTSHFSVATVSFDNHNWNRTTSMTVEPLLEGTTIITFANDVDSATFKIMIIVTE